MEICLKLVASPSNLSRVLLQEKAVSAACRVVGALRALNDETAANQIEKDMGAAGYSVASINPFDSKRLFLANMDRIISPYSGRMSAMWDKMRKDILEIFPIEPGRGKSEKTLRIIEMLYNEDSYHSLSIEGYHVTSELIERIHKGEWNPKTAAQDEEEKDALAAKGYNEAFKSVVESVKKVLNGEAAGKIFSTDIQNWYRELFKPTVAAGLLQAEDLAGYRGAQVYIKGARHVPPPQTAVLDSMATLEKLLTNEESAAVRAILGHFIFVFIHPYMDGNGRIGRFIMNLMLISGGYNWTVIRTAERRRYMESLEAASVNGDIRPFAEFVVSEMTYWKDFQKVLMCT